jgi:hypothetical protein
VRHHAHLTASGPKERVQAKWPCLDYILGFALNGPKQLNNNSRRFPKNCGFWIGIIKNHLHAGFRVWLAVG